MSSALHDPRARVRGRRAAPAGVHTVLAVLFCSKPQARIALQFMTTFKATNARPTRRRKGFESTRVRRGVERGARGPGQGAAAGGETGHVPEGTGVRRGLGLRSRARTCSARLQARRRARAAAPRAGDRRPQKSPHNAAGNAFSCIARRII